MTDEQLQEIAGVTYRAIASKLPHEACLLASLRAIEAAATSPLLERINELQLKYTQARDRVDQFTYITEWQQERIAELEAKLAHANEVVDQRNKVLSAANATPAAPGQQEPVAWLYSTDQGRGKPWASTQPPNSQDPQGLADAEMLVIPLFTRSTAT